MLAIALLASACLSTNCQREAPGKKAETPKIGTAVKDADPAKKEASLQPLGPEASAKQDGPAPAGPESPAIPAKEEKKTTKAPARPSTPAAPDPPAKEKGPQPPKPSVAEPKPGTAAEEPPAFPAEPPVEPENTPAAAAGGNEPFTETGTPADGPAQGNDEPTGNNGAERPEEPAAEERAGEEASTPEPAALKSLPDIHPMSCSDASLSFDDYILAVAGNFEKQKIAYNSIPLSDCSGMFHRMVLAVKDFCPAYQYPEADEARDTRALARWYYDNNNLVIVQDAAASGHLIRPGSVMFFGNSEVKYTNITIDKIAVRGGIEHMGTVVEVEKDRDGNVIGYTMFHGRNPRKPAGNTKHKLKNSNRKVPPFGNWTQQWVAVANIATQGVGQ